MLKNKLFLFSLLLFSNCAIQASDLDLVRAIELIKSRKYSSKSVKAFIGFVDLIDGAERLIDTQNINPVHDLERIVEAVTNLIDASILDLSIDASEKVEIVNIIDDFKIKINNLISTGPVKNSFDSDTERKKLIEGLATILYNAVYILIDPSSMKPCLASMLGGIYKVVSAILADGKIDRRDWGSLLRALASIFNLSRHLNVSHDYSVTAT